MWISLSPTRARRSRPAGSGVLPVARHAGWAGLHPERHRQTRPHLRYRYGAARRRPGVELGARRDAGRQAGVCRPAPAASGCCRKLAGYCCWAMRPRCLPCALSSPRCLPRCRCCGSQKWAMRRRFRMLIAPFADEQLANTHPAFRQRDEQPAGAGRQPLRTAGRGRAGVAGLRTPGRRVSEGAFINEMGISRAALFAKGYWKRAKLISRARCNSGE